MTKINLIVGLCLILLVACGDSVRHSSVNTPVPTRAGANEPTTTTPEERNAIVAGINSLALTLYQATTQGTDENFVFSPYSVAQAFSMLYAGAEGETKVEMTQVFHFLPQPTQSRGFH